jgi:tRNA A-37 threonylcarbamoyl transferase component Bud32
MPAEPAESSGEGTQNVTREIEDLLFRVCPSCRTLFAAGTAVCTNDGSRLVEQSLLARESLFRDSELVSQLFKKLCRDCEAEYPLDAEGCKLCGGPLEVETMAHAVTEREDRIGTVIASKYRLLEDIGSGGFGHVYLARHESLGKRFAVKLLRSKYSREGRFRERFREEALKLSRLEDENIVKVIDFGEWEDFQYMVTEFIEGRELGTVIYEEKADPLRAARILRQVASALSEAHLQQVVHLDLKPTNILVSRKRGRDTVKVIDFGVAEIFSEAQGSRQAQVVGTCTYMPPEQWRREHLDPRADIYSFGVILYEFLAGRPPFRHTSMRALEKAHLEEVPPPLRKLRHDVPPELEQIAQRCLEKDPAKRFASAEAVEKALAAFVRRRENVLSRRLLAIGAACAAAALLAAFMLGIKGFGREGVPPTLTVSARAVETTGDAKDTGLLLFDSLRLPAPRDRGEPSPVHTKAGGIELNVEEIHGLKARVRCSNQGEVYFEHELTEPGPLPPILLRPGENVILLRTEHITGSQLSGEEVLARVKHLAAPLAFEVAPCPAEGVLELGEGAWLTRIERIDLQAAVPGAHERLQDGAEIRYRWQGETELQASGWTPAEIASGVKTLTIALPRRGLNVIVFQPFVDLYGNRSKELALAIHRDPDPPAIRLAVSELTYYGEKPPCVRFEWDDAHLASLDAIEILDARGQPLARAAYGITRVSGKAFDLNFTDPRTLAGDGRHLFHIRARDRIDNVSDPKDGEFAVLADHAPPEMTVRSPLAMRAFRSGDSITFKAHVKDSFLDGVAVKVAIAVRAPEGSHDQTFTLDRSPAGDTWEISVPVGAGGIPKPSLFGEADPRVEATFVAQDASGGRTQCTASARFAWENGDRLWWKKDGSILTYHEPARKEPAFFIAAHEVSNRQFARFVAETGNAPPHSLDWQAGRCLPDRLDLPVRKVNWEDVTAYARWAELEPIKCSQWLVAAFWDYGETAERAFPWGNSMPGQVPVPAGELPAPANPDDERLAGGKTPLGVACLFGNVWELALDGSTGAIHCLGGSFETHSEVFLQSQTVYRKYLRGEPPESCALGSTERRHDVGFRLGLRAPPRADMPESEQ